MHSYSFMDEDRLNQTEILKPKTRLTNKKYHDGGRGSLSKEVISKSLTPIRINYEC